MHFCTTTRRVLHKKYDKDDEKILWTAIRFSISRWNCCITIRRMAGGPRTYAFVWVILVLDLIICIVLSLAAVARAHKTQNSDKDAVSHVQDMTTTLSSSKSTETTQSKRRKRKAELPSSTSWISSCSSGHLIDTTKTVSCLENWRSDVPESSRLKRILQISCLKALLLKAVLTAVCRTVRLLPFVLHRSVHIGSQVSSARKSKQIATTSSSSVSGSSGSF